MKDLIIIGAGPAGMSAAIYAARKKMDFSIIGKDFGGHMALASEIDNYPSLRNVPGYELAVKFREHMKSYGVKIDDSEVLKVEKKGKTFLVSTKEKSIESKALLIATGRKSKELTAKNADKFKGKGISYCATCDAPLFADKIVAVIGGGNSAMDAALQLSKYASKIYILIRKKAPRADPVMVDKVLAANKVELWADSEVHEFKGEQFVSSVVVKKEGKLVELKLDGVFSEIGWEPNSAFIDIVKKNEFGEIRFDESCRTSVEGVFAAGDVTSNFAKQIVISAGSGATAVIAAERYLNSLK